MDLYENLTETVPGTLESRFKSFSDAVKSVGVENGGGERGGFILLATLCGLTRR